MVCKTVAMNLWHPFTPMGNGTSPIKIIRGDGAYLHDDEGKSYLDGISSWWVNLHGHAHPYIAEAIAKQAYSLEHVLLADFTHEPAEELAQRLLSLLPGEMGKVFFSDNGSTAVETGMKIALQHWHNRGEPRKTIVSFEGAYHGDTFGAMAAAGATRYNRPFQDHLFPVRSIAPPLPGQENASLRQLEEILDTEEVAFFLFEPLILAAGGMRLYRPEAIDPLLKLCHENGVITIADEVMTGFSRTGRYFASDFLEEKPQITCLAKGITGGFLPLAATVCTDAIFEPFQSASLEKALLHGHTYCGNPIGCRAALASLDLLETVDVEWIEKAHQNFCAMWAGKSRLMRCESVGTLLVLEFPEKVPSSFFYERGILLRPLGNVVYVLPPYCISKQELQSIYSILELLL